MNRLLKNGSVAAYVGIDSFDRPLYQIQIKERTHVVVDISLGRGVHSELHTRSHSIGEPDSMLSDEYQLQPLEDDT